jgi:hypothetical protein
LERRFARTTGIDHLARRGLLRAIARSPAKAVYGPDYPCCGESVTRATRIPGALCHIVYALRAGNRRS